MVNIEYRKSLFLEGSGQGALIWAARRKPPLITRVWNMLHHQPANAKWKTACNWTILSCVVQKVSYFSIFIKSIWKLIDVDRFSWNLSAKEIPEYCQLVLNIPCMTNFVTSSNTVFEAAVWV